RPLGGSLVNLAQALKCLHLVSVACTMRHISMDSQRVTHHMSGSSRLQNRKIPMLISLFICSLFIRHYREVFIISNIFTHSSFKRSFWRKLWRAHAISITISSNSMRVFLKISLTMRHRLAPAITCSTTILELERTRFRNLSPIESVPFRGFFWVDR